MHALLNKTQVLVDVGRLRHCCQFHVCLPEAKAAGSPKEAPKEAPEAEEAEDKGEAPKEADVQAEAELVCVVSLLSVACTELYYSIKSPHSCACKPSEG